MFLYLGSLSSSFMYLIQAFWLDAVEAAERIAHPPLSPISLPGVWMWLRPIVSGAALLMKSWRQFVSESNVTTATPLAIACLSCGQSAAGSLPAMTIALAPVWMAVWIAG